MPSPVRLLALLPSVLLLAACGPRSVAGTIRLEAESGALGSVSVATVAPGFSGSGYVTERTTDGSTITLTSTAPAGIYDLVLGYGAKNERGFDLTVNGIGLSGMIPPSGPDGTWGRQPLGKVELPTGTSTIVIQKSWGWYDIDYLDLVPATPFPPPAKPPVTLVDAQASPAAKDLMQRLVDLYGTTTLTGTYSQEDAERIRNATGQVPAMQGWDLIEYSPTRVEHGTNPWGSSERVIESMKRSGRIATLMWHWNAPKDLIDAPYERDGKKVDAHWYFGFYTHSTTFDLTKALADPTGQDYALLLRDIDVIAAELKKFEAAGIPVLWRPLHEASGGWFWWGAKGSASYKALWRLLYDRITTHHHIHNLIWVYTGDGNTEWYPGDDLVDIVGVDAYPQDWRDPMTTMWESCQKAYGGRKLVALSEYGGLPDLSKMARFGVRFSFAVAWGGGEWLPKRTPEELKAIVAPPAASNLAEWQR